MKKTKRLGLMIGLMLILAGSALAATSDVPNDEPPLFFDDFEQPDGPPQKWERVDEPITLPSGNSYHSIWNVIHPEDHPNGALSAQWNNYPEGDFSIVITGYLVTTQGAEWQDYLAQVTKYRWASDDYQLLLRFQDLDNFIAYGRYGNGMYVQVVSGGQRIFTNWIPGAPVFHNPETLAASIQGRHIKAYSDGNLIFETNLPQGTPMYGRIGLRTRHCCQLFDDVFVNAIPQADAGGPYSAYEGGSVNVEASGTDPDGGSGELTYEWDMDNDGEFETPGQSATFSAADLDGPSTHTIAVQVTDDDGLSAIDQATVDVLNVAPSVGPITAPTDPVQVNTEINASAEFTDPGVLDTHTAVWDWGDDTTSVGVVNEADGSGSVTGSHTYTDPGVYTVKLTVTDDDGDSGQSVFQFIIVYDPDGGFVSGCGWFNSPAGAYADDDQLAGRATFGFVSKYDRIAGVPEGETEFHFVAASFFKFHSDTYEWLVVAPEHRAMYQGTGTAWVEGEEQEGSYDFRLTAIDGDLDGTGEDKFRIRIWGSGGVIYDNEITAGEYDDPTTAIEEGSIIVHTTKWTK